MRYIVEHWRGRQGFAWSFWINLVLLSAVMVALQEWSGISGKDGSGTNRNLLLSVFVCQVLLFVWQAVGVLRASEAHIAATGSMAPVWGAQISLIVVFFLVVSNGFGLLPRFVPAPEMPQTLTDIRAERGAGYSIEPSADGTMLRVSGSLEPGITRNFQNAFSNHPAVILVELSSTGGNIYEARGLAKIIRENHLNTRVVFECSSACTTVFIGGAERQLAVGGRLGFHQYRIDASYPVLGIDVGREQERDRKVFSAAGAAGWFLDRMFESTAPEMWYPEREELIRANVVNSNGPVSEGN